jgi:hypothetical protein
MACAQGSYYERALPYMINDGLEMQLLVLRDMEEVALYTGSDSPMACAICFQVESLCLCTINPLLWPVGDVATKLEKYIRRRQQYAKY